MADKKREGLAARPIRVDDFRFWAEYDGSLEHAAVYHRRSSFLAFSIAINQETGDRLLSVAMVAWHPDSSLFLPSVWDPKRRRSQIRTGDLILSGMSVRWGKLIRVSED